MALTPSEFDSGIPNYNFVAGTFVNIKNYDSSNKYITLHNGYLAMRGPESGAGLVGIFNGYITIGANEYDMTFVRKGTALWVQSGSIQTLNFYPDANE